MLFLCYRYWVLSQSNIIFTFLFLFLVFLHYLWTIVLKFDVLLVNKVYSCLKIWGPPTLLFCGYWVLFPQGKNSWGMKLTTPLHSVVYHRGVRVDSFSFTLMSCCIISIWISIQTENRGSTATSCYDVLTYCCVQLLSLVTTDLFCVYYKMRVKFTELWWW